MRGSIDQGKELFAAVAVSCRCARQSRCARTVGLVLVRIVVLFHDLGLVVIRRSLVFIDERVGERFPHLLGEGLDERLRADDVVKARHGDDRLIGLVIHGRDDCFDEEVHCLGVVVRGVIPVRRCLEDRSDVDAVHDLLKSLPALARELPRDVVYPDLGEEVVVGKGFTGDRSVERTHDQLLFVRETHCALLSFSIYVLFR